MDTIRADEAFLASLHRQRVFPDDAFVPLLTWITPCPPAPIMALLERFGRIRRLRAGECIFGPNDRFDALVLLTKGLGGRVFGSLYNQPGSAIALSVPGRIIGGNHCFFSGRPGVGQYFLLTEGEALYVPRKQILSELREDVALFECFAAFLDMLFQGDRLGFGAIALLPAKSRLLLWALTWGFIFGELETVGGEERLVFEPMLPVSLLSRVVSANPSQVKRDLMALRRSGELVRTGAGASVRSASLDAVWQWLREAEEPAAAFRRAAFGDPADPPVPDGIRIVIHQKNFQVVIGLPKQAGQRPLQAVPAAVCGHHHADQRIIHSNRSLHCSLHF